MKAGRGETGEVGSMEKQSRNAIRLWFRLLSVLFLFAMIPHKATAIELNPNGISPHKKTHLKKQLPELRSLSSGRMQQMLEQRIKGLHLQRAVRDKRLAVALVDLTNKNAPRLAQINGDEMMYAASMPKIAILLAAFERISEGTLPLDASLRETMTQMIRFSSNRAATQMIRKVGGDYINSVLESPRYSLYDPIHNGGLWVGKEYGIAHVFHRDPLHHLSHGATALQTARYYYLLESGRLVSPEASHEMKSILAHSGISHKFVKGLEAKHYPDLHIYRKSGTWRSYHADSALIEHDGRRYIAVAIAQDPKGGVWMQQLIREMDDIIVGLHAVDGVVASADAAALPASAVRQRSSSSTHWM